MSSIRRHIHDVLDERFWSSFSLSHEVKEFRFHGLNHVLLNGKNLLMVYLESELRWKRSPTTVLALIDAGNLVTLAHVEKMYFNAE